MKSFFIYLSITVISACAVIVAYGTFSLNLIHAGVFGGVLFVALSALHYVHSQSRMLTHIQKQIDDIYDLGHENSKRVDHITSTMGGIQRGIVAVSRKELLPVSKELEVLAKLVKQLAEGMANTDHRLQRLAVKSERQAEKAIKVAQHSVAMQAAVQPAPVAAHMQASYVNPHAPSVHDLQQTVHHSVSISQNDVEQEARSRSETLETEKQNGLSLVESEPAAEPISGKVIRSAIRSTNMAVWMQQIVSLPQRKTQFYQILSALRDGNGELLDNDTVRAYAVEHGISSALDNLVLSRTVQLLKRLFARNPTSRLFCRVSLPSLLDSDFFASFEEFMGSNPDLAKNIIFEIDQSELEARGPIETESLLALADMGFIFAINDVRDLSVDFKPYSEQGFEYIKIDARALLDADKTKIGDIYAIDLPQFLKRYDITVIVDGVDDESQALELLDFDVSLGQGNVFGAARVINDDVFRGARRSSTKDAPSTPKNVARNVS